MNYQLTFNPKEETRPKDYSQSQLLEGLLVSGLTGLVFGLGHFTGRIFIHWISKQRVLNN